MSAMNVSKNSKAMAGKQKTMSWKTLKHTVELMQTAESETINVMFSFIIIYHQDGKIQILINTILKETSRQYKKD